MCFLSIPLCTGGGGSSQQEKEAEKARPLHPQSDPRLAASSSSAAHQTKDGSAPPPAAVRSGAATASSKRLSYSKKSKSSSDSSRVQSDQVISFIRGCRWGHVMCVWSAAFVIVMCCFVFDQLPMRSVDGVIRMFASVCQTLRWEDGVICVRGDQFIKSNRQQTSSTIMWHLSRLFFQTEYLPCRIKVFLHPFKTQLSLSTNFQLENVLYPAWPRQWKLYESPRTLF
jgi:hypothetical protein